MDNLWDIKTLAAKLNVGIDWVRTRVRRGEIPVVPHMGRLIRFHPKTIERMFGHGDTSSLKTEKKGADCRKHSKPNGGARWQP